MIDRETHSSDSPSGLSHLGMVRHGKIQLNAPTDWPEGMLVEVRLVEPMSSEIREGHHSQDHAIIAGFGLAGRWAAALFDRYGVDYVIVERNPKTVERQERLGKSVVHGDICDEAVLRQAGIKEATILALTMPEDQAVLKATTAARKLRPDLYIIARTMYASSGLVARTLGAEDIVQAERVVAHDMFEKLTRRLMLACPDLLTAQPELRNNP